MKYLNGEYYVEVKDHRYRVHPTESFFNENEIFQLFENIISCSK